MDRLEEPIIFPNDSLKNAQHQILRQQVRLTNSKYPSPKSRIGPRSLEAGIDFQAACIPDRQSRQLVHQPILLFLFQPHSLGAASKKMFQYRISPSSAQNRTCQKPGMLQKRPGLDARRFKMPFRKHGYLAARSRIHLPHFLFHPHRAQKAGLIVSQGSGENPPVLEIIDTEDILAYGVYLPGQLSARQASRTVRAYLFLDPRSKRYLLYRLPGGGTGILIFSPDREMRDALIREQWIFQVT